MAWDSDYSNEGRNYAQGTDDTAYGGRYSGFDPAYDPSTGQYRGDHGGGIGAGGVSDEDQSLAEMQRLSKQELGELGLGGISPGSTLNRGFLESLFSPGSMAYRLGMRMPGTEQAKNFFGHETADERADRLDLIGQAVDATFGTLARTAIPAPVNLALGLYQGYQDYQDTGNARSALSKALSGQRGLLGAAGAAASGDYGRAVTSGLAGRVDPMSANLAGIGVNAAQGKNVQKSLGGLFGGYAGSRLGGPLGAVIGSRAGRSLSDLF